MKTTFKPALIVVDYQYDFASPDGKLSVPGGNLVGNTIKQLVDLFTEKGWDVIFTGDDHPKNHISFASTHGVQPFTIVNGQTVWPDHCVRETKGVKLYPPFNTPAYDISIKKGYIKDEYEKYSAFSGVTLDETMTLDELLQSKGITDTYITGLATDWCSGDTALDSANPKKVQHPYKTTFVRDAAKGVDDNASEAKITTMRTKGIIVQTANEAITTLIAK